MHYGKTTKELVLDWAQEHLKPGVTFTAEPVVRWFADNYPLLNEKTVRMHLKGMSANNGAHRRHHPHIRSDSNWDHFIEVRAGVYRLYQPAVDPSPQYS